MNVYEIYDLLFKGKKLEIDFPSATAAENFRVRLHQYKAKIEKPMIDLGFLPETDQKAFSFRVKKKSIEQLDLELQDGIFLPDQVSVVMQFTAKHIMMQYTVRILDDDDLSDPAEKVDYHGEP